MAADSQPPLCESISYWLGQKQLDAGSSPRGCPGSGDGFGGNGGRSVPGPEHNRRTGWHRNSMSDKGTIEVCPTAVATIAAEAVSECYGVVGMASRTWQDGFPM